jgi:hypothetical protein
MKGSRITVRFPADLRRRLKHTARGSGTRESAYERFKKAGLIGVVRGASKDLSTNPKHFDRFGGSRTAG